MAAAPSPVNAAHIPALLKAEKRWAPWRAQYQPGLLKFGKVPVRLDNPQYGLSSAAPDKWAHFEQALQVCNVPESNLAGIGFVMTGAQNLVGIDLDRAVAGGQIKPWAREIVDQFNSYTEISPSGTGLRIFVQGAQADDWTNNEQGVEVYAGHKPRFLTVTGAHVDGTPTEVREAPPGALAWLATEHRRAEARPVGAVGEMPDLLPVAPEVDPLTVPAATVKLLAGEEPEDGSRALFVAAVSMLKAGMNDAQALTVLWHNPFTQAIAMRHRREDADRALAYLWEHHVSKARPIADMSRVSDGDWARIEAELAAAADAADAADIGFEEASGAAPPAAEPMFAFEWAEDWVPRDVPLDWIIPGVLPRSDLIGVHGESGAGKTFAVLDMLVRAALGDEDMPSIWNGIEIYKPRRIAYIAAEDAFGVRMRLRAISKAFSVPLAKLPIAILDAAPNLMEPDEVKKIIRGMRAVGGKFDLVVLDTLSQTVPGANENSSEDMSKALLHARKIRQLSGATVMLIGHAGKDIARGQRGWSGLKGAMDAQIEVTRDAKNPEQRQLRVSKLKNGRGEGRVFPFHLEEVVVGEDERGADITSCVIHADGGQVDFGDASEKPTTKKGERNAEAFFAAYEAALRDLLSHGSMRRADAEQAAYVRLFNDKQWSIYAEDKAGWKNAMYAYLTKHGGAAVFEAFKGEPDPANGRPTARIRLRPCDF